jgi:hypothetical protein
MFVDPDKVIYPNHPTLRYRIEVDMIEVADRHVPSNSSSDGDTGNDCGSLLRPWPKGSRPSDPATDGLAVMRVRLLPISCRRMAVLVPKTSSSAHFAWATMTCCGRRATILGAPTKV